MDKRLSENKRVKVCIAAAFCELLQNRPADDISVVEITARAQVSRMAYYRNFNSKTDIIEYYLSEIIWSDLNDYLDKDFVWLSTEFCIHFFEIMKKHREIILLLYDCGYASIILNVFNLKNEELAGDMPASSIEKYRLYCAAGAAFNIAITWLRDGCKENTVELIESLKAFFRKWSE